MTRFRLCGFPVVRARLALYQEQIWRVPVKTSEHLLVGERGAGGIELHQVHVIGIVGVL